MTSRRTSFWDTLGAITKSPAKPKKAPEQLSLPVSAQQLKYAVEQEVAIAEWNRLSPNRTVSDDNASPAVKKALAALNTRLAEGNSK